MGVLGACLWPTALPPPHRPNSVVVLALPKSPSKGKSKPPRTPSPSEVSSQASTKSLSRRQASSCLEQSSADRQRDDSLSSQALEEHLPVGMVVNNPQLFTLFKAYITSQHASENLWFWLAVQRFQKHKYKQPNLKLQQVLEQAGNGSSSTCRPWKQSGQTEAVSDTLEHIKLAKAYKMSMSKISMMMDAQKVFDLFIKSGAPMECFISPRTRDEIIKVFEETPHKCTQDVFAKAAREVYITMERDVLPRFLKVHQDNPMLNEQVEKYHRRRRGDDSLRSRNNIHLRSYSSSLGSSIVFSDSEAE